MPASPTPTPVEVDTVDAAQAVDSAKSSVQSVIDSVETKNASLYQQAADLKSQIQGLQRQLVEVNQQIAAVETDDVKKARQIQRAIDMIEKGQGRGPFLRGI